MKMKTPEFQQNTLEKETEVSLQRPKTISDWALLYGLLCGHPMFTNLIILPTESGKKISFAEFKKISKEVTEDSEYKNLISDADKIIIGK